VRRLETIEFKWLEKLEMSIPLNTVMSHWPSPA